MVQLVPKGLQSCVCQKHFFLEKVPFVFLPTCRRNCCVAEKLSTYHQHSLFPDNNDKKELLRYIRRWNTPFEGRGVLLPFILFDCVTTLAGKFRLSVLRLAMWCKMSPVAENREPAYFLQNISFSRSLLKIVKKNPESNEAAQCSKF